MAVHVVLEGTEIVCCVLCVWRCVWWWWWWWWWCVEAQAEEQRALRRKALLGEGAKVSLPQIWC